MKVAVVIIWRETESRLPLKEYIESWYKKILPEADIIFVDSGDEIFSISASRNLGTKLASGYDVIVHGDADTYCHPEALHESIKLAYETGLAVNPFSAAKLLTPETTALVLRNRIDPYSVDGDVYPGSCGGIVVAKPETLDAIHGWDEKFIGWGFEDVAFAITHLTLLEKDMLKIPDSYVYCLSHVINNREEKLVNLGKERCMLYESLIGNKAGILELIGK